MFEQENGRENAYLVSVYNLFINLYQFQWQVKSTDTIDHLSFGVSLKLMSVWDHSVNMNFNVFLFNVYKRFLFLSRFFTFFLF